MTFLSAMLEQEESFDKGNIAQLVVNIVELLKHFTLEQTSIVW